MSTYVGRDVQLRELTERFDAVLVTAGCFEPTYIGIPGEDSVGVMAGIVFLERAYRGRPVEVGKRVVVLGGGYTAMDCSSTSWRLGAEDIYIVYRRSRDEMVVDEEELGETAREGMEFVYLASPVEVLADARGHVRGVKIARYLDPIAASVNVPEYHEIVTLRRSSTPDNLGQIAGQGDRARIYHNMSVDYDRIPRQEMPKLTKGERRGLFLEVNRGYETAQAVAESDRCLKCNFNIEIIGELCIICGGCVDVCPMDVIHMVDMSDVVDDGSIPGVGQAKKWQNGVAFFLDETACIRCALCVIRCPTDAITMNRYGTVTPSVGRTLPKESIDDAMHLDLTGGRRM